MKTNLFSEATLCLEVLSLLQLYELLSHSSECCLCLPELSEKAFVPKCSFCTKHESAPYTICRENTIIFDKEKMMILNPDDDGVQLIYLFERRS
ncbi:hypothetical protein CEXT_604361 [Caerostris extrusa]|uniref:Uncharacterized protein n=1 Tax=Caerostris extrusa TaxID=172846 RepID=A0AAV4RD09_CAEEX|nr:hypothetical protein CEXT_604361 [Caerostris extrusa]